MKRPARSLLSVSVLAPVVAALAVAAGPANAAPTGAVPGGAVRGAGAPPGPSTALLHDAAVAVAPVTAPLPAPVTGTAGRTAKQVTGAVDGVVRTASSTPGLRSASGLRSAPGVRSASGRPCALSPRKTVKKHTGVNLPRTSLPSAAKGPLKAVPQGHCIAAGRRVATSGKPAPTDPITRVPKTLLKDAGKVGGALNASHLGGLPGVSTLQGQRRAGAAPVVPMMSHRRPESTQRAALPAPPADDLVGQTNAVVNEVGKTVDRSGSGVGGVGEALKPTGRAGKPADGPLSLPDAAGIDLPDLSRLP